MKEPIKCGTNRMPAGEDRRLDILSLNPVAKARLFHAGFPQDPITLKARLDGMAQYPGLDRFGQVLMFSAEGSTDPMKFRKVMLDYEYPTI